MTRWHGVSVGDLRQLMADTGRPTDQFVTITSIPSSYPHLDLDLEGLIEDVAKEEEVWGGYQRASHLICNDAASVLCE